MRQHGHNLPHVAHNCLVIILATYAVVRVSGRVLNNPDVLAPVNVALFLARSEVGLVVRTYFFDVINILPVSS